MSAKSKTIAGSELNSQPVDNKIWPVWSDAELNNEKWTAPKNYPDGLFVDTEPVPMPPSLEAHSWIRATDLKDLSEPPTMFNADPADWLANNGHIMHSEFVRWFLSAVSSLEYCGKDGLEISGENANFFWNGRSQPWRGWANLYSMNKAGKGAQHRPLVNPNGKYVARLHFVGHWRRIVIDDMIPVDEEGTPLLPRTKNNFELWPMLLAKALLKLCSLTYYPPREIVDFHPVTCFTGWTCLNLSVDHLTPQDGWDLITKYAEQFESRTEEDEYQGPPRVQINGERKKSKDSLRKLRATGKPQPVSLFMGLKDAGVHDPEAAAGLSTFPFHFVYVAQTRDMPLDPKDVKAPLARWKMYRWLDWAIDQGLIDPAEYFVPTRYVKIAGPFGEEKFASAEKQRTETPNTGRQSLSTDPSVWCDFNKMHPYVKEVLIFYKPEYFPYTVRISDDPPVTRAKAGKKPEAKKGSKKGSKKSSRSNVTSAREAEFLDSYNWPRDTFNVRNEPLYLFCDSLEEKFFLINFSTSQIDLSTGYSDQTEPKNEACLFVERHSWFYPPDKPNVLTIATIGTKSGVIELEPGRHLLRVYRRSEFDSFVAVSSDTAFQVGDRLKIQRLMSAEAERIDLLVKNISRCIATAYQSFGTDNYLQARREYYRSYMPDGDLVKTRKDKILCREIHDFFVEQMVNLVKRSFPEKQIGDIFRSLRVFFLNPEIGLGRFDRMSVMLKTLEQIKAATWRRTKGASEEKRSKVSESWIEQDQAARRIEAFFKMITIRRYKAIHDPGNKEHERVRENLLRLAELFDYEERESPVHRWLRLVVQRDHRLPEFYPWTDDLEHVLHVQEYHGNLGDVKTWDRWTPIARLLGNPEESETVFAGIELFMDLPRCGLGVFNNETGCELNRVPGWPSRYQRARTGYTVFAYGWSEGHRSTRELEWTVNVITVRGEPVFRLSADQEPLSSGTVLRSPVVQEQAVGYLPNRKCRIGRWIVRVRGRCLVSFRLRTSYDQVEISLRVVTGDEKVLGQVEGKAVAFLPVVSLDPEETRRNLTDAGLDEVHDGADPINRGEYYVEAFVLNDSWPLTETEWNVVNEAKTRRESPAKSKLPSLVNGKPARSELPGRARRVSRQSTDGAQPESPYSVLQVVFDPGTNLEVTEDRRTEKRLERMKETWHRENPEGLQRGREFREAFINEYGVPASVESETEPARIVSTSSTERPEPRYLKPVRTDSYDFPSIDLSQFTEETAESTTGYDELEEENRLEREIARARRAHEKFQRALEARVENEWKWYKKIFLDCKNSFWDRRDQLERIYDSLRACIAETKPASTAGKTAKKSRKKKTKS